MPCSPPPSLCRAATGCCAPRWECAGPQGGVGMVYFLLTIFGVSNAAEIWYPAAIAILLRALWDIAADQVSQRQGLKIIALALARRNDLRAIGPLLEAWRPVSFWGRPLPDDDIEHELTRLLPLFLTQRSLDLRSYKKRHLRRKTSRLFPRRHLLRPAAPISAFSDARADAVVTVLQLLARSHAEPDHALLKRISRRTAAAPNDVFVRDAAVVCLERRLTATASGTTVPLLPVSPLTMPTPAPAPVALVKRR